MLTRLVLGLNVVKAEVAVEEVEEGKAEEWVAEEVEEAAEEAVEAVGVGVGKLHFSIIESRRNFA